MSALTKFVDDNFKPARISDILGSFPLLIMVLAMFAVVFSLVFFAWARTSLIEWVPGLVSTSAVLIAYYSFLMASRKYVNKRLANKEAKRLSSLPHLPDKSDETLCLLPPLVALKQENYYFVKLAVLYEVNRDLFKPDKLMEYYYLN